LREDGLPDPWDESWPYDDPDDHPPPRSYPSVLDPGSQSSPIDLDDERLYGESFSDAEPPRSKAKTKPPLARSQRGLRQTGLDLFPSSASDSS